MKDDSPEVYRVLGPIWGEPSPLYHGCIDGYLDEVKHYMENGVVTQEYIDTGLGMAIKNGRIGITRYLISMGGDPHAVRDDISYAAADGSHRMSMFRYLIGEKIINPAYYKSVVGSAAIGGKATLIKLLVDAGWDVTAENNEAYRFAKEYHKTRTMEYIVSVVKKEIQKQLLIYLLNKKGKILHKDLIDTTTDLIMNKKKFYHYR